MRGFAGLAGFVGLAALVALVALAVPSGHCAAGGSAAFDYARGVGLVEGDVEDSLWLMIADTTLVAGDSLTLIEDDPEPDSDSSPAIFAAAVAERLRRNPAVKMLPNPSDAFYRLVAPPGALQCCIFGYAVRAPRASIQIQQGRPQADLDRDGVPEYFQSCAESRRLRATVWSGKPPRSAARWSRRYETGYDMLPTCPPPPAPTPRLVPTR